MILAHVRAALHLVSSLVPVLLVIAPEDAVRTLMITFFILLAMSYPMVPTAPAHSKFTGSISFLELAGCGLIIMDIFFLNRGTVFIEVRPPREYPAQARLSWVSG